MELLLWEHKKLWRKRSTKISVLLCFLYVVIFGNILWLQWFGLGSSGDHTNAFGNHFDGYGVIRDSQAYSLEAGGELTDGSLRQLVRDYQELENAGMETALEKTDQYIISSWLGVLYPELRDPESYKIMISYVNPEKLTDFYERRQRAIEEFLENNGQSGAEKEYLLQMNARVKEPFRYEWTEGWSNLLGSTAADLGVVMALFLAIVLSAAFAGEWHDNTGLLILTTRNGRQKLALAKIYSGLLFTTEFFVLLMAGSVVSQIFFLGTAGWDMPIQTIKLIAVAPMNMLQAEVYEYAFTFLGAVGFAGVVMLISAKVRSNVPALLLSLAVVYGPAMVARYLPYEVQKALELIPLVGSPADVFRTNTFHMFGKYVWSPYLLISVPVLIGVLCIPFAVRGWAGRSGV